MLDTETKGTGAEMVPLERALEQKRKRAPKGEAIEVVRETKRSPRPEEPAPARAPARFKVVDVLSRRVLAEDAGVRETVAALGAVRSIVDVNIYVWDPDAEDWRPLPLSRRRLLFSAAAAVP